MADPTSSLDDSPVLLTLDSRVSSQEACFSYNANSQFHPLLGQPIFVSNANFLERPFEVNVASHFPITDSNQTNLDWCIFGQSSEEVITSELKRKHPEYDENIRDVKPKIELEEDEPEEIVPELTSELIIKDEDVKTELINTVARPLDNSDPPALSEQNVGKTCPQTVDIHCQTKNYVLQPANKNDNLGLQPQFQNIGISSISFNTNDFVLFNLQSSKQTKVQEISNALPDSSLADASGLRKLDPIANRTELQKRTSNIDDKCSSILPATEIHNIVSVQSSCELQSQNVSEPSMKTVETINSCLPSSSRSLIVPSYLPSSTANDQSAHKKLESSLQLKQIPCIENIATKFPISSQIVSPNVSTVTKSSTHRAVSQPSTMISQVKFSAVKVHPQNQNVSKNNLLKPSIINQIDLKISVPRLASNLQMPERNTKTSTEQKLSHGVVKNLSEPSQIFKSQNVSTNLPDSRALLGAKLISVPKSSSTDVKTSQLKITGGFNSNIMSTHSNNKAVSPVNLQKNQSNNIIISNSTTSITSKNSISFKNLQQDNVNIMTSKTVPSSLNNNQENETQKPFISYRTDSDKNSVQTMWKNTTRCYYNRKKLVSTVEKESVPSSVISTPQRMLERAVMIQKKPKSTSSKTAAEVGPQEQLARLCRVCAKSSPLVVDIFSSLESRQLLPSIIWQYLKIKVERGDRLPQQVCTDCRSLLLGFHCLKLGRVQAENKLQGLLKRVDQLNSQQQKENNDNVMMPSAKPWASEVVVSTDQVAAEKSPEKPGKVHTTSLQLSPETRSGAGLNTPVGTAPVLEYLDCKYPEPPYDCCIQSCPYISAPYVSAKNGIRSLQKHYFNVHEKLSMCEYCLETFINEEAKSIHVNDRHMIPCIVCGEKFLGFKKLRDHCTVVHYVYAPAPVQPKKNNYFCKCCDFASFSRGIMQNHYVVKHKKYFCYKCSELFDSYNLQYQHFQEIHLAYCDSCKADFSTYKAVLCHISRCHKKKGLSVIQFPKSESQVYKCKYCPTELSSKHNVKRHYYWFHKKYSCEHCLTPFNSLEMEEKHFNETHTKQCCAACGEGFSNQELLAKHVKNTHPNFKSHFCEFCGDSCKNRDVLKEHRKTHIDAFVDPKLCDVCGKKCSSDNHLKLHQMKVHHCSNKIIRNTTCKICGKNFKNIPGLNLHITRIHTKKSREKNFKCTICNEYYATMSSLNFHIIRHSKYECELCNMQFKFKLHLEEHVTDIHSVPAAYKCLICSQVFLNQVAFSSHLLVHTTDEISSCATPLSTKVPAMKCQLCDELFLCKELLRTHMRQKHIRGGKIVNKSALKPIGRKPYLVRVN